MKIAYIGIDLFYPVLCTLEEIGCEIEEIFTCETDNVTEFNQKIISFAEKNNIIYTTGRITVSDLARLKQKGCHAVICGGYYFRIPLFEELPMINIHPSLLPMGRGSWPMPISILRREAQSGVTIHKIAEGFDTGDILLQKSFEMCEDENLKTFMEKASGLAAAMIRQVIENFEELYKNAKPQGIGEYLEAPTEKDWTVTSDMTFAEADLILRAFYGYECVYSNGDERYTMINAVAVKEMPENGKYFKLKDGFVCIDSANM